MAGTTGAEVGVLGEVDTGALIIPSSYWPFPSLIAYNGIPFFLSTAKVFFIVFTYFHGK